VEEDGFLLALSLADSKALWGTTYRGSGPQRARELAVGPTGRGCVAGNCDGALVDDQSRHSGVLDGFVRCYDSTGTLLSGIGITNGADSLPIGGVALGSCQLAVAGHCTGSSDLGNGARVSQDGHDIFVAVYDLAGR